jgi:hypothetical protein
MWANNQAHTGAEACSSRQGVEAYNTQTNRVNCTQNYRRTARPTFDPIVHSNASIHPRPQGGGPLQVASSGNSLSTGRTHDSNSPHFRAGRQCTQLTPKPHPLHSAFKRPHEQSNVVVTRSEAHGAPRRCPSLAPCGAPLHRRTRASAKTDSNWENIPECRSAEVATPVDGQKTGGGANSVLGATHNIEGSA